MGITGFFRILGCVMVVVYLIFGIDDLIWYIWAFISEIILKRRDHESDLDFNVLRNTPPKMLAVTIAAWHESNVIGNVITNFLNTTDYPKSMYHLFVGVYPNDPDTIEAVREMEKIYPNVHPVINCAPGPTTKAQNLNHVILEIKKYEEEHHIRFAAVTIHDAEDAIHTYELLTTNYLIDRRDALQFPVFPILKYPTFRNFFKQLTTATYGDEFAESHFITMVQRRDTGAFVPCAGTGFAISRHVLDLFGDEPVLPSESLTEDYLLSLNLYKKGVHTYYVLNKLLRVLKNGRTKRDYITTRSLFPSTFKAAVRQKTRWTYGITMQSVGIRDVFTREKISFAGRYSFYKDFKTKFLNLLPLLGYIAAIYAIIAAMTGLDPAYKKGSAIYYMSIVVFCITCFRQAARGYALYEVYGLRSAFFGCLLPPLFPIRLIYGNIINFCAAVGAFRMKLRLGAANKRRQKADLGKAADAKTSAAGDVKPSAAADAKSNAAADAGRDQKKVKPKWEKTDHEFLTRDQLRQYRRMLGDVLIVQGYISDSQLKDALKHMDKGHGESLGAYLINNGIITEEQMVRSLCHVKHIQFVPNEIVKKLDYQDTMHRFDKKMLIEKRILPLTEENGFTIIGICNETREDDIKNFEEENGLRIKKMYMMEKWMLEALSDDETIGERLRCLTFYHENKISYEQVVLIGKFSSMYSASEEEMMSSMGIRV